MKYLYLSMALIAAVFTTTARAEVINCTEITAVPVVITAQGIYCLKGDLTTALTAGNMIDIQTNNVTIDLNGFKLGGLAAGLGTTANGISALNRKNITIRNGAIRGFLRGINLDQNFGVSSGHLIEDMLMDGNRETGIFAAGNSMIIRRNRVVNTGPGNISLGANGISLLSASNTAVTDNFISGVSETSSSTGINLVITTLIEVRGNTIFNITGAAANRGIFVFGSTDITVTGNRILNATATGTDGIADSGVTTGLNCIDNIITGYAMSLNGCDFSFGNLSP